MVIFNIITIFPKIFDSYFNESILKRAQAKKLIKIKIHNLRDFTIDRHKVVDNPPYGGGPGMVMKVEPIYKAIQKIKARNKKARVILFSTRGKKFDKLSVKRLSQYKELVLICGRYEGVDERVARNIADEEISIGDFILSGGELPAMILVEAVSRQIKGVLGRHESLEEIKGSYPVYTRPEEFKTKNGRKLKVPAVLLSGNHKKIDSWRKSFDK